MKTQIRKPGDLPGKVAVVTGASRGIGLSIAKALADAGAHVAITGRDQKALAVAGKKLGKNTFVARLDVRNQRGVKQFFAEVKKRYGHIDLLVNNAGIAHANLTVENMPFEVWQPVVATNLDALFLVTHHALPLMGKGGVIVNNLSRAAVHPFEGMSAYNASKAGALAFTNSLRMEVRKRGIRVTALIPGAIETDIWEQFWADAPRDKMLSSTEVANVVLQVLALPAGATIEQLQIGPTSGDL